MPARLLLVRHGETEWSATGRHTGRTDIPLTAEGREMAVALGAVLKSAPWDGLPDAEVFTSPLLRARETCELAGLGARALAADELMEWDYGKYEGLTGGTIRGEYRRDWLIWRDGVPEGETLDQVAERVDGFLAGVHGRYGVPAPGSTRMHGADGTVAVFAHGHLLRILAARWLGLPAAYGQRFQLAPASLSVLGWEYAESAVQVWNDTGHLSHLR
jgi:probable phosphoglycerate mutase